MFIAILNYISGTGVTTYAVHPGFVTTELVREYRGSCLVSCFNCIQNCFRGGYLTAAEGAATSLYCCLEPTIAEHSGRYYESVVFNSNIKM